MKRCVVRAVPALLAIAAATTAVHAAPRVYVASTGVDNPTCSLAQPCRSFAAAHVNVDPGGEIVALDAAGYGAVTVTKSVTITANPGVFAGIAASTGAAVTIDAPDIVVTLRNLQINGNGAERGVSGMAGKRLVVENCTISNFLLNGIAITADGMEAVVAGTVISNNYHGFATISGATSTVANSQILYNSGAGVYAIGSPTRVAVTDSVFVGNGYGLGAQASSSISATRLLVTNSEHSGFYSSAALIVVGYSQVSYNKVYGFLQSGAGSFYTLGNNQVFGNIEGASSGTISSYAPM